MKPNKNKKTTGPKAPGPTVRERLRRGAAMVADGLKLAEASRRLGFAEDYLGNCARAFPDLWRKLIDHQEAKPQRAGPIVCERLRCGAVLVIAGVGIHDASRQLGLGKDYLADCIEAFPKVWERILAKQRKGAARQPTKAEITKKIREATAMAAAGASEREIGQAMKVPFHTVHDWRKKFPVIWQEELDRAMAAVLVTVRRAAGTDAVLDDPNYMRRAEACESWCRARGEPVFPAKEKPTVATFYRDYYQPTRLNEAARATVLGYQTVIRRWVLLTGDPPLVDITNETLARYRNALERLPGKRGHLPLTAASVSRHLRHLQAILDKAGPPGFRNRDAAGILLTVPWIRKPRVDTPPPKIPTPDQINAVYLAAVAMDKPRFPGVKAPAWWRALLAIAYNTGLRHRSLFELRWKEVDWERRRLVLPPRRLKSRRMQVVPLNPTALHYLRSIKGTGDRELVFGGYWCDRNFQRYFHRLQDAAGLPPDEHFGLHNLRKALGTQLWGDSPQAAQLALGHSSSDVTRNHYVLADPIVAAALDRLPQPEAFTSNPPPSAA